MTSVLGILPACVSLTALELRCVSTPVLLVLVLLLAAFRNKCSLRPPLLLSQVLKERGGRGEEEEEEEGDPFVSFFVSMPFLFFSPFPQMFPALQPLNFSFCYALTRLPESLGSLATLATLDLSGCLEFTRLPAWVGQRTTWDSLHE
jgi:hypothetical protein